MATLLFAGFFAMPARGQQLFQYTEGPVDPEAESWEVEVNLDVIRSGDSAFSILPPSGESVGAELRFFEDRRNGNALWVGRVIGDSHDSLQFTLHGGYLVGTYAGSVGTHFGLRAGPDGRGRLELRELPAEESCGIDDEVLSEILLRDREAHGEEDLAGFELDSDNGSPTGIVYANGRFYVPDSGYYVQEAGYAVFAYDRSGDRASSYDFHLGTNTASRAGITFANERFYVLPGSDDVVYAYDSGGNRASAYDFLLDSDTRSPAGITYANERFYVLPDSGYVVHAYDSSGNRASSYDFGLDTENQDPDGIAYDGVRFYVVEGNGETGGKVFAYESSGNRASSYDFGLEPDNTSPVGITHAGGRLYVVDELGSVYAYSIGSRSRATGLDQAVPSPPDELSASAGSEVEVAEANGSYELTLLPLVDPEAVYHWESTKGSNVQAEIIALFDYANMVFRNNRLSVRLVAPPAAMDAAGRPVPVWAPLTLLNDRDGANGRYPYPLYERSAALERLRSRYGADLIELLQYASNRGSRCGVADHIWLSDGTGTPRAASDVARLNGMSQTNVSCRGGGTTTFVHEIGHLLGAMHDDVREIGGGVALPCFQEQGGGRAYSCEAYGFFLNSGYPATIDEYPQGIDPTRAWGTIMAYSSNRVPFFSSTRVPSPIIGGPVGGPRFANNEAVLGVTAPEAAFFDQHLPSSPPVDVTVNSDAGNIYFSWPALPLVRGAMDIYYMQDAFFSKDLSEAPRGGWQYLPGPYVGSPRTGVTAPRPGGVDPGTRFFAFVVCLWHNEVQVCSEPAVQGGQTWTTVAKPADLRVTPSANVDNLVSLQWDDVADTEDGYKVQVRAGSRPWREPGLTVEPSAHLVRRNETRAELWGLDRVGTGREDVLHFRVCAVRRWADDACSETVSLERSEVGGGPEATLGFDPTSVRVNEGDQARLTVRLSEAVSSAVTLAWSTADGSATGGADYTAQSGTLTIAAGRTTTGLTVSTLTDSVVEGDETFRVMLSAASSSGLPSGVTFGATTATVTIVDQTPATSPAPTRLRVLGDTTALGSVKLAWDDNSSNETGFVIEVAIPFIGTPFEVHRGPNTTSAIVSGLSANAYYRFSVRALTGQVESDPSNALYARSTSRPSHGESTSCSHFQDLARLGQRNEYVVRMCWQTPSGVETDALDFELAARDSGLLYFLERDNAEVLLKVLDFCSHNGYRWVFVAPVTTLAYRLTVSGPGGRSNTFSNGAGQTAGSRIHKAGFPCSGSSAAAVESGPRPVPAGDSLLHAPGLAPDAASDRSVVNALLPTSDGLADVTAASAPSCTLRSTGLTLAGGYRVDACWQSGDGRSGPAVDWRLPSSQSGILYFFQRDNAEVLVKVLDGCGVNNRRWVFVAPVTDLGLRLRVTAPDGTRWDYENRVGSVAVPRSDTSAFVCR